jgi:hypothetical protein
MATKWVKTTSHRSRERLAALCRSAGVEAPTAWFRRSPHPCQFRVEGEFWEVPADLSVSGIRGLVELKRPVPKSELIRPMSWS